MKRIYLFIILIMAGLFIVNCGRTGQFTSSGMLPGSVIYTVDTTGDTGYFSSMAFDNNGNPWIAYYDATDGVLKLAHYNGGGFVTEVVDKNGDTGLYPSLAIDGNNVPHITYYDATDSVLKYAYKTQQGWVIKTIDPFNPNGTYSSLKLDVNGNPHFTYITAAPLNYELKYGFISSSNGLNLQFVDTGASLQQGYGTGDINFTSSLQLTPQGIPYVSYYNASNGTLKLGSYDTSTQQWNLQIVANGSELQPSSKDVGMYNSLVLDSANNPHISYYDADNGTLRYAYNDGTGWNYEYIDAESFVGAYNSIAIDQFGNPVVAYQDVTNDALKFAIRGNKGWSTYYVDRSDIYRTGYWISMAKSPAGGLGISYRNATSHALMFAYINYY